jgi:recombination protein RecA
MGTFIEIASDSGLGKSTILLHMCKSLCAAGKNVMYCDVEAGVNDSQIDGIGLRPFYDVNFFLKQPKTFSALDNLLKIAIDPASEVSVCIVDSVTALLPKKVSEGDVEDIQPGIHARLTSTLFNKYKNAFRESGITVFWVNQMRTKLNFRGLSVKDAAGGEAQKFMMDIRLRMSQKEKLSRKVAIISEEKPKEIPYGSDNYLWAEKTRYTAPFIPGVVTVLFGKGVSNMAAYALWMKAHGYVKQGGAGYFKINLPEQEEISLRGADAFMGWVKDNLPAIKELINNAGGYSIVEEKEDSE